MNPQKVIKINLSASSKNLFGAVEALENKIAALEESLDTDKYYIIDASTYDVYETPSPHSMAYSGSGGPFEWKANCHVHVGEVAPF